jgi:hypothetical protein
MTDRLTKKADRQTESEKDRLNRQPDRVKERKKERQTD